MSSVGLDTRWIDLEGAANARSVVSEVLLRSDNLQSLTERDRRVLIDDEGVEVVLDLRTDVEVSLEGPGPMTREPRVRIEHRSLYPDSGGNTDFELDALKPWQRLRDVGPVDESLTVRAYLSYLLRRPDSIVGSLRTIASAEGAVLVHCAAGKDRTGVVVALALDAVGFDRHDVAADYLASGERIEAIMGRLLGSPTYRADLVGQEPAGLAPTPGTMERVLQVIDQRFGGSVRWLSANGFERRDLDRLQRRLRPNHAGSPDSA